MASMYDIEQSAEIMQGQAHIWSLTLAFAGPMSLKCATELGIPDIIHKHSGPITLTELVEALKINNVKADGLKRLMRILTHLGFFTKENISLNYDHAKEEEVYSLTPLSRILVEKHPFSLKSFVLFQLDSLLTEPYQHLSKWFGNDDPTPFHTSRGMPFWEGKELDVKFNKTYDEGMASDTPILLSMIAKSCTDVFEGFNSLVDVGGGTGSLAKGIMKAYPQITHSTVLDLQNVIAGFQGTENLKYVAGDMFEFIPPADSILLKGVIHNWGDDKSVQILKKCRDAITRKGNGGKLIIIDFVISDSDKADDKSIETQLCFDMLMLTVVTGRERTEKEWAKLFSDAGFKSYKITSFSTLRSVIEVYP